MANELQLAETISRRVLLLSPMQWLAGPTATQPAVLQPAQPRHFVICSNSSSMGKA